MKGYSKIKVIDHTQKSRSMEFSDVSIFSFPHDQTLKPTKNMMITNSSEAQESNQISKDSNSKNMTANNQKCLPDHEQVDQDEAGNYKLERFGAVLSRNCSVSSNSGFQSAVKRALSMRRSSSSVSERYCRIHDQSMTLTSPTTDDDDDDGDSTARASRSRRSSMDPKKHRPGGKILKACKRLFGL